MHFHVPLELDSIFNYELELMFFSVYNTIFNITENNNVFKYKEKELDEWIIIKIKPGAYELKTLDFYIRNMLGKIGDQDKIKLNVNLSTTKCKMINKVFVDFSVPNNFLIY